MKLDHCYFETPDLSLAYAQTQTRTASTSQRVSGEPHFICAVINLHQETHRCHGHLLAASSAMIAIRHLLERAAATAPSHSTHHIASQTSNERKHIVNTARQLKSKPPKLSRSSMLWQPTKPSTAGTGGGEPGARVTGHEMPPRVDGQRGSIPTHRRATQSQQRCGDPAVASGWTGDLDLVTSRGSSLVRTLVCWGLRLSRDVDICHRPTVTTPRIESSGGEMQKR